jgi:hypothetical protein
MVQGHGLEFEVDIRQIHLLAATEMYDCVNALGDELRLLSNYHFHIPLRNFVSQRTSFINS